MRVGENTKRIKRWKVLKKNTVESFAKLNVSRLGFIFRSKGRRAGKTGSRRISSACRPYAVIRCIFHIKHVYWCISQWQQRGMEENVKLLKNSTVCGTARRITRIHKCKILMQNDNRIRCSRPLGSR